MFNKNKDHFVRSYFEIPVFCIFQVLIKIVLIKRNACSLDVHKDSNSSVNPVGSKKENPALVISYLNRDSFRKGCDFFWRIFKSHRHTGTHYSERRSATDGSQHQLPCSILSWFS